MRLYRDQNVADWWTTEYPPWTRRWFRTRSWFAWFTVRRTLTSARARRVARFTQRYARGPRRQALGIHTHLNADTVCCDNCGQTWGWAKRVYASVTHLPHSVQFQTATWIWNSILQVVGFAVRTDIGRIMGGTRVVIKNSSWWHSLIVSDNSEVWRVCHTVLVMVHLISNRKTHDRLYARGEAVVMPALCHPRPRLCWNLERR